MKKIIISLSIALLAYSISYAASDGQKHFYGEWITGGELGIVFIISEDAIETILGTIDLVQEIQKWEPVKNSNKTTNASYPNGYKLRTKNKDGRISNVFLWRHSKNNDRIRFQTQEGLLEKGEGEGDIINRVKKSAPLKQTDYYGVWNLTNGTYVDELSITTISSKTIKYSSIENTGEPVEFYFPILRWEPTKNTDQASSYNFPDGYIISTESTGGVPKTIVLWRHSKNKDMILFQTDAGNLLLTRATQPVFTAEQTAVMTDSRDGKRYKTVKIGGQVWMAENLNYNASGSKCYENNSAYCAKYGRLYNWSTAKKVCPSGWHLPSESEYKVLDKAVGGEEVASRKLKSKSGWNNSSNGTDEFRFSALPGGYGDSDGSFYAGLCGWWSATEDDSINAYSRFMSDEFVGDFEFAGWFNINKSSLFSVRCLLD